MSMMLEASGLSLPRRLEPTSLSLAEGELVCLIGPNGSGKTSLLHAIAGIGTPAGEVRIDGIKPGGLPPGKRQKLLSFLPASRDVKWPLVARDLIALGSPAGTDIHWLVRDLNLEELADRRMDRLSTGERSRVLIARALAARPRLLLLDEPVANLDPLWQLRLMDYLRGLARAEGQALLVAVHDLELARLYADRLIIMHERRIVTDGNPQQLLGGSEIPRVFGIERTQHGWRPVG